MLKKEISREDYLWVLYSSSEGLFLSVTCGRSAVFSIQFKLTKEEEKEYAQRGNEYLTLLAYRVQDHPNGYIARGKTKG